MIDERMLAISRDLPVAQLPFVEKLRQAVAYFCVYEAGDHITGANPRVAMCWLDGDGTCRRFVYVVDDEPLSFPGDGDKVFVQFFEAQRAAGRLDDVEAEIPEHIANLFRARREHHISSSSPLLVFEEVIARTEMEGLLRVLAELDVATMDPNPERHCVDGDEYRVLIKTMQGNSYDLLWSEAPYDERLRRLGELCRTSFNRAWKRPPKRSNRLFRMLRFLGCQAWKRAPKPPNRA